MRNARTWLGLCIALLAVALAGCRGTRGGACGCEPVACAPAACAPCAVAEPCNPCGPRPPEAKPGEAWCCVWVPPVEVDRCEQVCVCPETKRCVWVPPSYGTRPRLECVAPAQINERVKPGVYAQRQNDVILRPERECVDRICCPTGDLAPGERQCGCVVKRVQPAVWGKECERVCLEPEKRCVDFTPASYRCVEERYQISPGFMQNVVEPARYETRTQRVCVKPGRWEWRRNERCELPKPAELTALQLEMVDANPDGTNAGIFKVGSQARYDVIVSGDAGSADLKGLVVSFTLPPELEFVSGSGEDGVQVSGSGQVAKSTAFDLGADRSLKLHILAAVKSAPPSQDVKVTAVVTDARGEMLALETENSTIPAQP